MTSSFLTAAVSVVAILMFGAGELIAWYQGSVVMAGTVVGGYTAARAVQILSQEWVRLFIVAVACCMTVYFFLATYAVV